MFVVIQTGGKQISVSYGQEIFVEKLAGKVAKDKVIFDEILMIDQQFGKPFLKGAEVHGEIVKQDKAKKIRVFKYKPKKNSKTMYGHRQPYTKVLITDILLAGKSLVDKTEQPKVVIKDELKKEVTAEVITPAIKEAKPVVKKLKKDITKEKVVNAKSNVTENMTESDNSKTVVSEDNVKTIFDHKNMTVKVIKENDEKDNKK